VGTVVSNMASSLSFSKEEQRAVIGFLWSEGVKTAETYCRMLLQYGDSWLVQIKVYDWVELFRNGRKSELNSVPSRHGRLQSNDGGAERPDRSGLTRDSDRIAPLM